MAQRFLSFSFSSTLPLFYTLILILIMLLLYYSASESVYIILIRNSQSKATKASQSDQVTQLPTSRTCGWATWKQLTSSQQFALTKKLLTAPRCQFQVLHHRCQLAMLFGTSLQFLQLRDLFPRNILSWHHLNHSVPSKTNRRQPVDM